MGESITSAIGIGLEARSDAHDWAREIQTLSHQVRLIAPQCVKPYVQGDKTDRPDAAAIGEAVSRPHMRFVPIHTEQHQPVVGTLTADSRGGGKWVDRLSAKPLNLLDS